MKRIILLILALVALSIAVSAQAYMGLTPEEVKKSFYDKGQYPYTLTWEHDDDNNSTFYLEAEYFKIYATVGYYSGTILNYDLVPTTEAFESAYMKVLNQKYYKPYTNCWKTPNGTYIKYKYSTDYGDYYFETTKY
jgi:hypothetical protein